VPAIAAELGVGRVFAKDESARMGLAAFKVLGASWAVHRVLSRRDAAGPVTLVAATDGNHGRALAWMARLLGQRAHVFVPTGVHPTTMRSGSPPRRPANQTPNSCRTPAGLATRRCPAGS
jgi:diaminopropionate ammonia-lyase